MPGMVSDVSATLVATTHSLVPGGGALNTYKKEMGMWNALPTMEKRQAVNSDGLQRDDNAYGIAGETQEQDQRLNSVSSSRGLYPTQLIPQKHPQGFQVEQTPVLSCI